MGSLPAATVALKRQVSNKMECASRNISHVPDISRYGGGEGCESQRLHPRAAASHALMPYRQILSPLTLL